MSGKGGKGFSVASKGKTATKSLARKPGSLKSKISSSAKKGESVQIDSDSEGFLEDNDLSSPKATGKTSADLKSGNKKVSFDNLKSGGKISLNTPTGDWGKSGKDYSGKGGGKGGISRSTATKPPITEVELKLELELPENARVLMDSEAAVALQGIQEHLTVLLGDPMIKIPESFGKVLEYSKINSHYTNVESARQVLDTLKRSQVNDGEICMIGNLAPETVEEVYALIPSLKKNRSKNEGPIRDALASLVSIKAPN